MAQDLSWVFRLYDQMSGPSNKIADAVHKAVNALDDAAKGTQKLSAAQRAAMNTQARVITAYAKYVSSVVKLANSQRQTVKAVNELNAAQLRQQKIAAGVATAQAKAAAAASKAAAEEAKLKRVLAGGGSGGGGGGSDRGNIFSMGLGLTGWYVSARAAMAGMKALGNAAMFLPKTIIGQGIEHTAMKEAAVEGMGVVLGNRALADKMMREAVRFAAITPLTTEETLKGYQQLVMGGLAPSKVMPLMSAISDLTSINMGHRQEAVENISRDVMQVMATGKMDMRNLRNLSSWGFPREAFYQALSGGVIPALKGASNADIVAAISKGQVGSQAFLYAFEKAMAGKGGGVLGGISDKLSHTMSGLWSTLISRPQELFMNMDKTPAWESLRKSLENLVNATDYNSPTGARLQQVLSEAFSRWTDALTKWLKDPAAVERWFNRLSDNFEKLIPLFEKFLGIMSTIVGNSHRAGTAAGWVGKAAHYFIGDPLGELFRGADIAGAAKDLYDEASTGGTPTRGVPDSLSRKKQGEYHFHINVTGASKEDAQVVAHEITKPLASLLEQFNLSKGLA